jgi:hypothetical protein
MTQRGKFVKPDALKYTASQNNLKSLIDVAKRNLGCFDYYVPEKEPFCVGLEFYMTKAHHCDLDNLCKALLDAAQGVLYKDDRYCDQLVAVRIKTESEPHVRLTILPMEQKK